MENLKLFFVFILVLQFSTAKAESLKVAKGEYLIGGLSSAASIQSKRIEHSTLIRLSQKDNSQGALGILSKSKTKREAVKYSLEQRINDCSKIKKMYPEMSYCEPNFQVKIQGIPDDPQFSSLWGMSKINAPSAWDISTGSASIIVAVIDTGVDYTHQDLAANIWNNSGEIADNDIDDDGNGYVDDVRGWDFVEGDNDPMDLNGHGTHVSGTIGAVGNNGIGVAGVNHNVSIMPLRFLDEDGSGYISDAEDAIVYAHDMGAKVLNNSWGGGGYSQSMYNVIDASNDTGIVFVAAAGNESSNNDKIPSYPANYKIANVISVAAQTSSGTLASFSNFGRKKVPLAAPGKNIYSTVPGDGYANYSGTSMAAPHVSGIIALMLSLNELSPSQIKSVLYSSVNALSGVKKQAKLRKKVKYAGFINVYDALLDVIGLP